MARLGRSGRWCGAFGVGLTMIYGLQLDARVNSLCVIVVAVVACVAALLGPRLHRPPARWPWRFLAVAAIAFLCGMLIRPWSVMQHGLGAYSADAFTLPGFAMLIVSLVLMLRSGGRLGRHAVADGIIICLGVALISIVFFALPAAEIQTRPKPISIIAGLYPILDVVMLLLLLNLGFSMAVRLVSFRSLAFGMFCLFIGDVGYSWIGAQGKLIGSPLLDLPFLLAYTSIAVAALDPSMTGLSSVVARQVQAWSQAAVFVDRAGVAQPVRAGGAAIPVTDRSHPRRRRHRRTDGRGAGPGDLGGAGVHAGAARAPRADHP